MTTHSSIIPGESHAQRSLTVYGSWGCKESATPEVTEYARMHSFVYIISLHLQNPVERVSFLSSMDLEHSRCSGKIFGINKRHYKPQHE